MGGSLTACQLRQLYLQFLPHCNALLCPHHNGPCVMELNTVAACVASVTDDQVSALLWKRHADAQYLSTYCQGFQNFRDKR